MGLCQSSRAWCCCKSIDLPGSPGRDQHVPRYARPNRVSHTWCWLPVSREISLAPETACKAPATSKSPPCLTVTINFGTLLLLLLLPFLFDYLLTRFRCQIRACYVCWVRRSWEEGWAYGLLLTLFMHICFLYKSIFSVIQWYVTCPKRNWEISFLSMGPNNGF